MFFRVPFIYILIFIVKYMKLITKYNRLRERERTLKILQYFKTKKEKYIRQQQQQQKLLLNRKFAFSN